MLSILLIDDESSKIANYRKVLEEFDEINPNFVHTASCVEQAEELVSKCQYDLVVLDLFIPNRLGEDPRPDNAVVFIEKLKYDDGLLIPHNIVAITQHVGANPIYKDIFEDNLLAYILYEHNSDEWKRKLRNKISFLLKAQNEVRIQDFYDYDVAIVNALPSENEVVRKLFGKKWNIVPFSSDLCNTFYTITVKHKGKKIRIVTCYALKMASTASAALTTKLIYYFRPRYLFMTGIAAGVDRNKVNLGDIMVATEVWDGASGKIKTDENGTDLFLPDYRQLSIKPEVEAMVKRLKEDSKLLYNIKNRFESGIGKPKTDLNVHCDPMVSVPAVLSSQRQVELLISHCRKLIGVEMEGYGLFYAAENTARPRPKYTVLIKSVSDYADPEKSDNYQEYAMYTSAAFAKYIILNELKYNF